MSTASAFPRSIVQVVQHLKPGGLEMMVMALAQRLAADRVVHVVSLEGTAPSPTWTPPSGVRLHFMNKPHGVSPLLPLRLAALFRRLGAGAIHTHHIGPLLYGGIAARLAGIGRVVHTEHDGWHLASPARCRLERRLLRLVRPSLVADARFVGAAVEAAIPFTRPIIVPNGVDTMRFCPGNRAAARAALGLPLDAPIVGVVARLETVKGVDVAIRGLALCPRDALLVIAGDGSERARLAALADRIGVAPLVRFLGHVSDPRTVYRALDVFCLPSRAEGLPLALLEAQACGVPAVATDVGGVPEALCPTTGTLVPPETPAALGRALAAALGRPRSVSPRPFVLGTADLDSMVDAYRSLLAA